MFEKCFKFNVTYRVHSMLAVLKSNPMRANDIAKKLKLHPQIISRLLVIMENNDYLLCEDDKGFLSVFPTGVRVNRTVKRYLVENGKYSLQVWG